jgi:hypothetical protein
MRAETKAAGCPRGAATKAVEEIEATLQKGPRAGLRVLIRMLPDPHRIGITMSAFNEDTARNVVQEKLLLPGNVERDVYTSVTSQWLIRVQGFWTPDGLQITHVTPGGPATKMRSPDGALTNVAISVNDTVVSINNFAVLNDRDWVRAMNSAPDHANVTLTIAEASDGSANDWFISPQQRPGSGGGGPGVHHLGVHHPEGCPGAVG